MVFQGDRSDPCQSVRRGRSGLGSTARRLGGHRGEVGRTDQGRGGAHFLSTCPMSVQSVIDQRG
jgi:hypothetical protein